jgi:hypothetical protein
MDNVIPMPGVSTYRPGEPIEPFIKPIDISVMSDEDIAAMLTAIRARRLVALVRYNNSKGLRNVASERRLLVRYDKVMAAMAKQLDRYDKYVEKLEDTANELRALRLQLGEDPT